MPLDPTPPEGAANGAPYLDGAALDRAFPFHLAFDRDLRVVRAGPTIARLMPAAGDAACLPDLFMLRRPNVGLHFDNIVARQADIFLLAARAQPDLVLRGQMLPMERQGLVLFLGSPWITDMETMVRLGLRIRDYAPQDPAADFLFLVQAQQKALAEAQALAGELKQARDDALHASQVKSAFLANMSHELRTPLNAIIGFSEMIEGQLLGPVDERYREYATHILASGRHLLELISDILDFSKADAGRLELQETAMDVSEVIQSCRRLVGRQAVEAGVTVAVQVEPDLPRLYADQRRIKQILINLLSNAVKFTPSGGEVVLLAATVPAGGVALTVRDTGIGMKPEDIAVALEPFRQVENAFARRYEGTGLGLPLVQKLVQLHGGVLEIDSKFGGGTTVRVTLPADRLLAETEAA